MLTVPSLCGWSIRLIASKRLTLPPRKRLGDTYPAWYVRLRIPGRGGSSLCRRARSARGRPIHARCGSGLRGLHPNARSRWCSSAALGCVDAGDGVGVAHAKKMRRRSVEREQMAHNTPYDALRRVLSVFGISSASWGRREPPRVLARPLCFRSRGAYLAARSARISSC